MESNEFGGYNYTTEERLRQEMADNIDNFAHRDHRDYDGYYEPDKIPEEE